LGAVEEDGVHGEWGSVYAGSDGLFKGLVAGRAVLLRCWS